MPFHRGVGRCLFDSKSHRLCDWDHHGSSPHSICISRSLTSESVAKAPSSLDPTPASTPGAFLYKSFLSILNVASPKSWTGPGSLTAAPFLLAVGAPRYCRRPRSNVIQRHAGPRSHPISKSTSLHIPSHFQVHICNLTYVIPSHIQVHILTHILIGYLGCPQRRRLFVDRQLPLVLSTVSRLLTLDVALLCRPSTTRS